MQTAIIDESTERPVSIATPCKHCKTAPRVYQLSKHKWCVRCLNTEKHRVHINASYGKTKAEAIENWNEHNEESK